MCGIAGIFKLNNESVDLEVLKRFTDSMMHRGPDSSGYELLDNGKLGFGHRRLSILDLTTAGHQPLYYLERYCIVYNGEIFNFNAIKDELKLKGYQFYTDTDTEVIIAAYDCYGLDCFHMFNGMWAFALWDMKERKLILSRDRYGVKPLYYTNVSEHMLAFASETRAFKFLDGFNRTINTAHYELNLKNNYALEGSGHTLFNDVFQLLPGHYMEIKYRELPIQKRWYDIQSRVKSLEMAEEEIHSTFYQLFRDACRIRLISDVPVATALSGGLDSSSIYSTVFDILQTEQNDRTSKDSQLAVSAVFPGLENDERIYVEKAVSYTKGAVRWVTTSSDRLSEDIERDTELFDAVTNAPITAISAIYKEMNKVGIKVSLDGHGVDEMLYGYLYMVYDLWAIALESQNKIKAAEYAEILSGLYHPDNQKEQREIFLKQNLETLTTVNNIKRKLKKLIKHSGTANQRYLPANLPALSDRPYDFSNLPPDQRMLYFEFFQNSLPTLLRNFDRAGMMNSVEIRMPFLDYRVVEFIFSLPVSSKIGDGFTKRIVRESMKHKMDESIRCRTFKVGIGSPFQYWADIYLKTWLFKKIEELNSNEKAYYKSLLEEYYISKNVTFLEEIWVKISLILIE